MSKIHSYRITTTWTGNLGSGTRDYRAYSRRHEIASASKAAVIPGSSDPAFRGDPARYSPEDLLVGALSSCHMLWLLHLCAESGIVVTEYSDEAVGEMTEHPDGSGEFTSVTLYPKITITDASRMEDVVALNAQAHRMCFVARSVNFPVKHEASVHVAGIHPKVGV